MLGNYRISNSLEKLRKKQVICPFAVPNDGYPLDRETDVEYICWFKAQNFLEQSSSKTVDPDICECTYAYTFAECELYKEGVPVL